MAVVGQSSSFHYMSVFSTSALKEGRLCVCERAAGLISVNVGVCIDMCFSVHVRYQPTV